MSNRVFGMAPGGRMSLDKAASKRRIVWYNAKKNQKTDRTIPRGKKNDDQLKREVSE